MTSALTPIDARTRALAATTVIEVVKDGHDKWSALRHYAEKTKDKEKLGEATEWLVRHEIRAGEIISEMKSQGLIDQGKGGDRKSQSRADTVKLAEFGITKSQSSRWQALARLSPGEQKEKIEQAKENAFAAIAKRVVQKNTNTEQKKRQEPANSEQIAAVRKLFNSMGARAFYLSLTEQQKDALNDEMNAEWEEREAAKAQREAQLKQLKEELRRSA
jgi:hypothetical protein